MNNQSLLLSFFLGLNLCCFSQGGLLGSYPFNGNANDVSGNGNHGSVYNAILTTDRFGNPNSAFLFNGTNSFINLGNNFNYSSHSFSCWARRDSASGNTLISKINNGPHDLKNSEFTISTFTIGNGTNWLTLNSTTIPDFSQWNCFVATYDATNNKSTFFINGVADSAILGAYMDVVNTPLFIGARPFWSGNNGPAFFFNGAIDDVNIYNRVLTQQQVDSLCNILTTSKNSLGDNQLIIFPNPFSTETNIRFTNEIRNATLRISDMFGRIIVEVNNINGKELTFRPDNLTSGIYCLSLFMNHQFVTAKKIIISD